MCTVSDDLRTARVHPNPNSRLRCFPLTVFVLLATTALHAPRSHRQGSKRVRMCPPSAGALRELAVFPVHCDSWHHSALQHSATMFTACGPTDVKNDPCKLGWVEVVVKANECLFIPENWIHAVESSPCTVAINFWRPTLDDELLTPPPQAAPSRLGDNAFADAAAWARSVAASLDVPLSSDCKDDAPSSLSFETCARVLLTNVHEELLATRAAVGRRERQQQDIVFADAERVFAGEAPPRKRCRLSDPDDADAGRLATRGLWLAPGLGQAAFRTRRVVRTMLEGAMAGELERVRQACARYVVMVVLVFSWYASWSRADSRKVSVEGGGAGVTRESLAAASSEVLRWGLDGDTSASASCYRTIGEVVRLLRLDPERADDEPPAPAALARLLCFQPIELDTPGTAVLVRPVSSWFERDPAASATAARAPAVSLFGAAVLAAVRPSELTWLFAELNACSRSPTTRASPLVPTVFDLVKDMDPSTCALVAAQAAREHAHSPVATAAPLLHALYLEDESVWPVVQSKRAAFAASVHRRLLVQLFGPFNAS